MTITVMNSEHFNTLESTHSPNINPHYEALYLMIGAHSLTFFVYFCYKSCKT